MSDIPMTEEESTSYDEIPYHSDPFPQSHPHVLATIATLFGMKPPPVERCRVLEIGCASGGNLIPMALEMPESTMVGIDSSAREIGEAKETAAVLGLQNVKFQKVNVMEIGPDFGEFDYIISHGVFSWVPPNVADKTLEVSAKNLSPNGVSYVSYNTLPGWHMRGMIRDMMCYHAKQFARPEVRLRQARALLKFLADSVPGEKNPYGIYLKNELELLQKMRDSYIYHEHLEKENNPVYFYQFIERAEAAGLQYLGESAFGAMALAAHDLPANVMATLQQVSPHLIHREQYMDFVRNRMFRQTLLCHKGVELDRSLKPEYMTSLSVTSPARPVAAEVDVSATEPLEFRLPGGLTVPIRQPITKAAVLHLSEIWPRGITFDNLRAAARSRLDPQSQPDEVAAKRDAHALAASFQSLYALGFIELGVRELPTSPKLSERPVASPLVRLQAQRGHIVTNRRHRTVGVDELERRVLEYLDGHHDRRQIQEILEGLVANGSSVVKKDSGGGAPTAEDVTKILGESLDRGLSRFEQTHLLVG
jgi:methyltransferase-like protein/SAM-dependent methyltransferase